MTPHLRWAKGGEARIVTLTTDSITLESTTPSPPGSRIDAVLLGDGSALRVKIHASRREEASGLFQLEGRPIDMSRALREELTKLLAQDASPPSSSQPPSTAPRG